MSSVSLIGTHVQVAGNTHAEVSWRVWHGALEGEGCGEALDQELAPSLPPSPQLKGLLCRYMLCLYLY